MPMTIIKFLYNIIDKTDISLGTNSTLVII